MMRGINPSTNKNPMNPTPNWMLASLLLLFVACQRQMQVADAGVEHAAAESTRVLRRGVISGHVTLTGTARPARIVRTPPDLQKTCGEVVVDQSLRLFRGGAIADVVVYLEDGPTLSKEGGAGKRPLTIIDQAKCMFTPPVAVDHAGDAVEILNSDPLLHNVRANRDSQVLFNFAMPLQGMRSRRQLPSQPGIVRLHCDVHPWMHAAIRTFDHPYFGISDESGAFQLPNVPSGRHKLVFWHPHLAERKVDVQLGDSPAILDQSWPADELTSE